jgi:hypothetical protein
LSGAMMCVIDFEPLRQVALLCTDDHSLAVDAGDL